jgi:hypothetical protein
MELLLSRAQTFFPSAVRIAGSTIDSGLLSTVLAFDFVTFFQFNHHRQPQAIFNTICPLMERRFHLATEQYMTRTDQPRGWTSTEDSVSLANGFGRNLLHCGDLEVRSTLSVRAYVLSVTSGGRG